MDPISIAMAIVAVAAKASPVVLAWIAAAHAAGATPAELVPHVEAILDSQSETAKAIADRKNAEALAAVTG